MKDCPYSEAALRKAEERAFLHRQKAMLEWEFLDQYLDKATDEEIEKLQSLKSGDKLSLSDGRVIKVR